MKRRVPLAKKGKSEAALLKEDIQAMVRAIVIKRDGGCILNSIWALGGYPQCNGRKNNGDLILQADHLVERSNSATYADTRLIVCVCKGHHGWKHFKKSNHDAYNALVRQILPPDRIALWEKAEQQSWKPHKMNWKLELAALKQELAAYEKA